jgi:hypothetical protein
MSITLWPDERQAAPCEDCAFSVGINIPDSRNKGRDEADTVVIGLAYEDRSRFAMAACGV